MSLEGKVVAITGASAGIGRASVREFAARGADVGLIARGEVRLAAAAEEVRRTGRRASVAPADVSDAEAVEAAAARIEAELGPIDIWVNAAMTAVLADGQVVVVVRDRGRGFDQPAAARPGGGRGIPDSILGRMRRQGGQAAIRTVPGAGTEVELRMPVART